MTSVEIISFTGTTPAQIYYCDSMSANCVFVASVTTFPYTFDVPSSYDFENFIVKVTDADNCTILEYVYVIPTPTPTSTQIDTLTPTPTFTQTPTETTTPTVTPTSTTTPPVPTPTRTAASTPLPPCETPTQTMTMTQTQTPTATIGSTSTPTPSVTETQTQTPTNTPTPSETPTNTPTVTNTQSETPTQTPTGTPVTTATPTITQTLTPSVTVTESVTPSPTLTSSITPSPTLTSSVTPSPTLTPSETPAVEIASFLLIESNQVSVRNTFNTYMAAGGSAFRGFNINSPNLNNQNTFNTQMNRYVSYTGWGTVQPTIRTGFTYNMTRGVDSFGVPIIANRMTTTLVQSGTTTPNNTNAWYTWFIPTGATGIQRYNTLSRTFDNPTGTTIFTQRANMSSIVFNYTGGTNIPNGTYRVYTTFTNQGFRFSQNNRNIYFRGGTLF